MLVRLSTDRWFIFQLPKASILPNGEGAGDITSEGLV